MYRMQESAYAGNLRLALKAAVVITVVFVVDQYSKVLAFGSESLANKSIVSGVFGFTHHQNFGIVANLPVPRWAIVVATCLILALVGRLLAHSIRSASLIKVLAYSLIIAGALGNLYDRTALGYVRDWILLFELSIINIADIAICGGILMLMGRGLGKRD